MRIIIIDNKSYDLTSIIDEQCKIYTFSNPKELYATIPEAEAKAKHSVYRSRIWVQARGCNTLFQCITKEGKMILNVFPSDDIYILGAVEVDRGMYDVELPLEEVERVWEERMPYLDFKYPEGLPTVAELDISDLKDTTKRFR